MGGWRPGQRKWGCTTLSSRCEAITPSKPVAHDTTVGLRLLTFQTVSAPQEKMLYRASCAEDRAAVAGSCGAGGVIASNSRSEGSRPLRLCHQSVAHSRPLPCTVCAVSSLLPRATPVMLRTCLRPLVTGRRFCPPLLAFCLAENDSGCSRPHGCSSCGCRSLRLRPRSQRGRRFSARHSFRLSISGARARIISLKYHFPVASGG